VIAALTLLAAVPNIRVVLMREDGPSLNNALATTGKLLLLYSVLLSVGWMI
jgi:1,4-dihydroxy-2-naphthoate octaprenyltransferase